MYIKYEQNLTVKEQDVLCFNINRLINIINQVPCFVVLNIQGPVVQS